MSDPVLDLLTRARARIEKPEAWTKGAIARTSDDERTLARDPQATCWCALGAIAAERGGEVHHPAWQAVQQQLPAGESIGSFNDHPDTTHADVLALFDRAIAARSQQ